MGMPRNQAAKVQSLDLRAILNAATELEEAFRNYAFDNAPNREWWGVLINRLWQVDLAMNPERLSHGDHRRDEHFRQLPILQSGPLSRIRMIADKIAGMFGLTGVIGQEALDGILTKAREAAANADYKAMPTDRSWADDLHSAAMGLSASVESVDTAKRNAKKSVLTEPMTKIEIADYFSCHRNAVDEQVLKRLYHEIVGGRRKKYRLRASDMPLEYMKKHSKQTGADSQDPKSP